MKWVLKSRNPFLEYHLKKDETVLLSIRIHYPTSGIRAECNTEKRAFFIQRSGFWKNRIEMRDEYGYSIGKLINNKGFSEGGIIEIEGERVNYKFRNHSLAELIFYKEDENNPIVNCGLHIKGPGSDMNFAHQSVTNNAEEKQYLLFALSWYLFHPVNQPSAVKYAL